MSSRSNHSTAIALAVIFAIVQVYVGTSFAAPNASVNGNADFAPQQIAAVLTVRGTKPVSVNGSNAISGATIIAGAQIEVPAGASASITIPSLGRVDAEPGAKFTITFDAATGIKVNLSEGCVTLHTNVGVPGEIDTPKGVAGKTDPSAEGTVRVCFERGAAAPVVDSGATAGGAGAGGGISAGAIAAILLGGGVAVAIILLRGDTPSPSSP